MMDLPTTIEITRCDSERTELASVKTLDRETAKNLIDAEWWTPTVAVVRDPKQEPDRHWDWRAIVSKHQNKPDFAAKCVVSQDGLVQAAVLFRVDALSALEKGERGVFVDRLATAPRNRDGLAKPGFSRRRDWPARVCDRFELFSGVLRKSKLDSCSERRILY